MKSLAPVGSLRPDRRRDCESLHLVPNRRSSRRQGMKAELQKQEIGSVDIGPQQILELKIYAERY